MLILLTYLLLVLLNKNDGSYYLVVERELPFESKSPKARHNKK
jgi:hypothetical protein